MLTQVKHTIFNLRQHLNTNLSSSHTRKEWLPSFCNGLIWRLELCGITDAFNADALWDRTTGSGRSITEASSGKTELRLHQALRDHQRWRGRQDAKHGRRIQSAQCFTDVVVCLPENVWKDDLNRTGGETINATIHNLSWHHQQDFKQDLAPGRQPRYLVRLEPNLAADRIIFLFGNGIYLPTDKDTPLLHIVPSIDDMPVASPRLNLLQDNFLPLGQPTGFYADQECLLFTPQDQGPLSLASWHAAADAYLLVRRIGDNNWLASSDNGGVAKAWQQDGIWCFERRPNNGTDGQTLSFKLAPAIVKQDGTIAFERFRYVLQLEALALPHLVPGLIKWSLWLNKFGMLATVEQIKHQPEELIKLDCDETGLQLHLPATPVSFIGKKITEPLPIGTTDAILLPFAVAGRIGVLKFAKPTSYTLDQEARILGRTDSETPDFHPDIALDKQIAQPGALTWKSNIHHRGGTLASLGLSRKHATLTVEDGQLVMEPAKANCVLQPLNSDSSLKFIENQNNEDNKTLRLEPGAGVLVANCILRFQIEAE